MYAEWRKAFEQYRRTKPEDGRWKIESSLSGNVKEPRSGDETEETIKEFDCQREDVGKDICKNRRTLEYTK